jgi:hypothetical protein
MRTGRRRNEDRLADRWNSRRLLPGRDLAGDGNPASSVNDELPMIWAILFSLTVFVMGFVAGFVIGKVV